MSRGEAQKKAWKSWGWTLTLHFLGRLKGQEGLGCVTEKEKVSLGRRSSGTHAVGTQSTQDWSWKGTGRKGQHQGDMVSAAAAGLKARELCDRFPIQIRMTVYRLPAFALILQMRK